MLANVFAIALLLASLAPSAALAVRSDWSAAGQSRLRLLLAEPNSETISGGIEIALEPGWYTYWRNPGEAGIPPSFDFSGSENVAGVEVLYPAPERYDDGFSVSLIYRDNVVFPIAVTPREAGEPVTLRLAARFGVCKEVCIPTAAEAAVTIDGAAAPDPLTEAVLERALPKVPGPAEPGRLDVETITAEGDALFINVRSPDSAYEDLFAEPPPGWFIGQPAPIGRTGTLSRYRLPLDRRPRGADISGQTFRFVAVAGGDAIEEVVVIP